MDDELVCFVKVPRNRIAVIIGHKGETKALIESETHSKLKVSPEEGMVRAKANDALDLYVVQEIIKAIARGFNPSKALNLLKSDYALQVIELKEFAKDQHFPRIKGRVIGHGGKARENIEQLTDTYISVFGKTISVIGRTENVDACARALVNLIEGSPHSSIYKWLEKKRNELKAQEILTKEELQDDFK
jgi:ribosomal RNA assembly protein